MPAPTPTLADVTAFIASHTSYSDLARLGDCIAQRRRALDAVTAANAAVGMPVRLHGLKIKYFNGLTGTITHLSDTHATVLLDADSTARLRRDGARTLSIPGDSVNHPLTGVPRPCCRPA